MMVRVSFAGFEFDDYATVLLSSVNFNYPFPDRYKRRIVHKGWVVFSLIQILFMRSNSYFAVGV